MEEGGCIRSDAAVYISIPAPEQAPSRASLAPTVAV